MHPREFGEYRILKLLPLGGMGRVYLATHARTNERIALKLIERGTDPARVEIVEAERRGATLQAELCRLDRRITQIRQFGELDDFFFIEMEYIDGEDLSEVLARGPLGVPFAARIGLDLCETLGLAHNFNTVIDGHKFHGIVHGDIKPRNLRITPDGELRVLDFGIAKALSLTRQFTQNNFGSSQYSSPERLSTGEVEIASDLWSVAVVVYECAAGRPYFTADSGPKLDLLIREYRRHQPFPPNWPEPFAAILRKALHPDESIRYATASDFAADLRAFLSGKAPVAVSQSGDDFEKTRRTVKPPSTAPVDDDATRRTAPPRPGATPPPPGPRPRPPLTPRQRQIRLYATALITVVLAVMFYNEYAVLKAAAALRHDIEAERLTDTEQAWQRYQTLASRSHLPLMMRGTRNAVLDRFVSIADRVIAEYRNSEAPSVSEADWVRAQAASARALELDPGEKAIRGRLYLAEGHLARIRGTSRVNGKLLNDARAKFEQAHDLMPKSPDPYLGLARLYVYSLKDVERAEDALKAASKRGHDMGRREKAQLGDGYRDRAERLLREADRVTGMPEEKDYLQRAKDDFGRAADYYRDIVPFAGSAASLRRVLDYSEHVDVRLRIIREGA